jgi:hypothetical protein
MLAAVEIGKEDLQFINTHGDGRIAGIAKAARH